MGGFRCSGRGGEFLRKRFVVCRDNSEPSAERQTVLITLFTLTMHATHYQQPAAQKQTMRVVLMPPVWVSLTGVFRAPCLDRRYAIVSFFSYRYYREYEYYILAEVGDLSPSLRAACSG